MPSKQNTPKVQSSNSICRAMGHGWMTTAAANWRVCKRERCRASEHLKDDQWVSNAAFYRKHVPVETDGTRARLQARQHRLWTEQGDEPARRTNS